MVIYLEDTDSEDESDAQRLHYTKRKHSNFIDDEAIEEKKERPKKETKFDEILYTSASAQQPVIVTPQKSTSNQHNNDVINKLEEEFMMAQSSFTPVTNPYAKKKKFYNKGELLYEKLKGNFVIIYVCAEGTKGNMYSLAAKIGIEKQVTLPRDNLQGLMFVELSSKPNSNEPLLSIDGYEHTFGYLFNYNNIKPSEKLQFIQERVTKLCDFLNTYVINKDGRGALDRENPVILGRPYSTYSIPSDPNITHSPERKLGDIAMVNDVRRVLEATFDYKDKKNHHLLQLFFNYPYNALLHQYFDLPNDDDDNTILKYMQNSNSNVRWS